MDAPAAYVVSSTTISIDGFDQITDKLGSSTQLAGEDGSPLVIVIQTNVSSAILLVAIQAVATWPSLPIGELM